jgi:hypothetical protein
LKEDLPTRNNKKVLYLPGNRKKGEIICLLKKVFLYLQKQKAKKT